MNLYIVSRIDEVDWDEYEAFVIAAKDETQALKFAKEKQNFGSFSIEQIIPEEEAPGIILSDYKAG